MIPVRVHGVGMSPYNQGFVALLMDDLSNKWLPIYIGSFEAQAIAMELDDVEPPRPMTHDLLANMIDELDAEIKQVVVSDLKDSTYYAEITLVPRGSKNGDEIIIDARPSDSIALALRTGADIFVDEDVMEEASIPAKAEEEESEETKKLKILQHRLQRAVEAEEFEEAAEIRDQIRQVQREIREEKESVELEEGLEEELTEEFENIEDFGEEIDLSEEDIPNMPEEEDEDDEEDK